MRPLFAFFCSIVALLAADRPAFFTMDTAARLEPTECAQVLADLGYSGLGGRPATAKAHATALQAKGLVFFNGWVVARSCLRKYRQVVDCYGQGYVVPVVILRWAQ